jgi:hypothetical protein
MEVSGMESLDSSGPARVFATTHWSVVLAAGDGDSPQAGAALEQLCRTYWYPLYAHVRRRGHDADQARDLTQGFFAEMLARHAIARAALSDMRDAVQPPTLSPCNQRPPLRVFDNVSHDSKQTNHEKRKGRYSYEVSCIDPRHRLERPGRIDRQGRR